MHSERSRKPKLLGIIISLCLPAAIAQQPTARIPSDGNPYQKWLDEDARYIITDRERADFERLTSNQQPTTISENSPDPRNPNPGLPKNEFQEEHYQRLAYANSHFAADVPGYKTGRGRIYIMYGPPSRVDRHFPQLVQKSFRKTTTALRFLLTGSSGTIDISTGSARM
jgi:GWxTD domain-containing protein